jgi:uncharacterized protein YggE
MLNGLLAVLTAFVVIAIIIGVKMIGPAGTNKANISTINVDGTGYAISVPDVATFSFSVTETAKTVSEAQTKATEKTNAALKAVRDQGIADKDISTQSYTINPHYEYQNAICPKPAVYNSASTDVAYCPNGRSVLTGYDVSQTIQVKVRDLSKAGAIFTSVGSLQVQNVNGLDFSVDDPLRVQAQARDLAIKDAKEKAEVLADQLGVRLVRVVSFSENTGGYPRPMYMAYGKGGADMAQSAPVAPEIPTGEQKVTSNVTITYEIR